jgi:heme exporter protein B
MQTELSIYLKQALAIWLRDLKSELRTKYAINAILMFAFTTLIAISFSIGAFRISESDKPFLYSALLWIILIFSALSGLSRSFVKEEEAHTSDILKLSAQHHAIFWGKLLFNLTLIGSLGVILVPAFIITMNYHIINGVYFTVVIITGALGLGAGTTIVAAMIARAHARGALFSAVAFPLLFPLLIIAIKGCEKAALNSGVAGWHEVKICIAYLVIMITLSHFLFPLIWEE